jgi:predicted CoA-binding protein
MPATEEAAAAFVADRRVALTGVSGNPKGHGSNVVYRRLRQRGSKVLAVNPNAGRVEDDRCHPDLRSIEGGVDAVVIGTRPELTEGCPCTFDSIADCGHKLMRFFFRLDGNVPARV